MARLTIRVDLGQGGALGPGKIRLLELIQAHGSISEAGRAMSMSYRRAWLLVDQLNRSFRHPVVSKQTGGRRGGGARLTPWGLRLMKRYRAIERDAALAVAPHLRALTLARSGRRLEAARRLAPARRRRASGARRPTG
jgi:molybdate transport system regulatory protein